MTARVRLSWSLPESSPAPIVRQEIYVREEVDGEDVDTLLEELGGTETTVVVEVDEGSVRFVHISYDADDDPSEEIVRRHDAASVDPAPVSDFVATNI